jgi:hypothetical protein
VAELKEVSTVDVDELVDRYMQGEAMFRLAAHYGLSHRKVRDVLVRRGIALRPHVPPIQPPPPGMVDAYRRGRSILTVGEDLGFTYGKTRRMLIHAGVQLWPHGGNGLNRKADSDDS